MTSSSIKVILSNPDPNNFLTLEFEARCEAAGMQAKIGRENARRRDTQATSMSQRLSLLHRDALVVLSEMGTEQICQMLHVGNANGTVSSEEWGRTSHVPSVVGG